MVKKLFFTMIMVASLLAINTQANAYCDDHKDEMCCSLMNSDGKNIKWFDEELLITDPIAEVFGFDGNGVVLTNALRTFSNHYPQKISKPFKLINTIKDDIKNSSRCLHLGSVIEGNYQKPYDNNAYYSFRNKLENSPWHESKTAKEVVCKNEVCKQKEFHYQVPLKEHYSFLVLFDEKDNYDKTYILFTKYKSYVDNFDEKTSQKNLKESLKVFKFVDKYILQPLATLFQFKEGYISKPLIALSTLSAFFYVLLHLN